MKVFSCPDAVPAPTPNYMNYDHAKEQAAEDAHIAALKKHLVEKGYTGKHTGGVVSFNVADGFARYMLADGKGAYGPSFLIHLPYGDAYQFRMVSGMTKKAIIEEIERAGRVAALFSARVGV